MSNTTSAPPLRHRIGWILGIALFLLVLAAPTPQGMTPEARRLAAVVLLMAVWWITEAVDIALTSLLPLVLFPLLGILPSEKVAPNYADHTIFLFLGGFIIALAIQKWDLHRRIALHVIRWVGTQPSRVLLGFMLATAFLSMWMSNTACAMMMFPIGMALVLQLATRPSEAGGGNPQIDLRVTENFGSVLMLAIAYAASLGGMATLVGTPTNLVFTGTVRKLFPAAPEVGFLQWMAVGLPLLALFLPLSWLYLCRFGGAAPLRDIRFASSQTVIEEELRKLGKITRPERSVLVIWVATAFLWIFRSPIDFGSFRVPGWSQLFGKPAFLHDATVAMTMAVVLCLIPVNAPVNVPANRGSVAEEKSGGRSFLMDWHTIRHGVPWGVLFLFGGGFAMAAAFEQTGLSSWAGSALRHLAGFPPIVMVALTSLAITFLSEVTSNTATALMVMPILAAAAVPVGIHPYLLMISGTLGASCGFMLPVATPPNAIVFSSGWITAPQMARAGLALDLMGVALITLVIYLLAVPVFGITLGQLPAWAQ